ncbi:MAG: HAMP domain-containing histidine kinase [candidate division Zixibacteria bacterium]|nr:HAMP domain-containing histidine kinase [candidate division Zixibacteria bacterium]
MQIQSSLRGFKRYFNYPTLLTLVLALGMVAIVFIFVYYNQTIISGLKQDATRVSRAYARLWQYAASEATSGDEINYIFEEIINKATFPIIVTDPQGTPMFWTVDVPQNDTSAEAMRKLKKQLVNMDSDNEPVPIYYGPEKKVIHYLHFGDSKMVHQLQYVPLIELSVIAVFVLVGFISFRNMKRSEQRSIWVGMAKETAHQLGTPLSSLTGWVELLKLKFNRDNFAMPDQSVNLNFDEIISRMESDLLRLDRIATRFGQIGSIPELELNDITVIIKEVVAYYKTRLPGKGKGVELIEQCGRIPRIMMNKELMAWVIENLIKNSLEAIDPKTGKILVQTECKNNKVIISVNDNCKGITPEIQKMIFRPGFSTKKRGWGLGLTLARRIVEEYHRGKIWLQVSEPNVKTEFRIELPVIYGKNDLVGR